MLIQQLSPEAGVQVRIMIISDIRCSYCNPTARSFIAMYDTAWSGFLFLSRGKKRKLMSSYFASYTEGVLPPTLPLSGLRLPPTSSPDIHLSIHHSSIVLYSSSTIQLHNTSTEKRKGKPLVRWKSHKQIATRNLLFLPLPALRGSLQVKLKQHPTPDASPMRQWCGNASPTLVDTSY